MKKAIGMFVALILALGMTGVAFAQWNETLYITGTVNTGTVDVAWSEGGSWDTDDYPYAPEGKDVSGIICEIDVEKPNILHVTVYNAYPCIDYFNVVDIHCVGSIPVHLYEVFVSPPDPNVLVEISYYEDAGCTVPAVLPVQLHTDDTIYVQIHVHITELALQNHTYMFDAEIKAVQWNMGP